MVSLTMGIAGKRVLVSGAGGFIGSHLVEALARAGADVHALLHYNAQGALGNLALVPEDVLSSVKIIHGDITDAEFCYNLVRDRDIVFHLGALIAIPYSYTAPRSYVATNISGTLNFLEAVRSQGSARLVHTSTSEVYGSARFVPMDESHPLQAQSPYAATKIGADKLVESYINSFGLNAVTVRPFNTFGPRQSARAVIPTIIGQALGGRGVIKLGSVTPIRDLTYVTDTVSGFITAATAENVVGGCYNLGTGRGVSIGELAQTLLDLMGSKARIESDSQRLRPEASEVDRLISSHDAFTAATGWQPEVSLEDGLARTVAFFQANPHLLPKAGYVI
ncbi:NAD-dependent epimerase/dehydratase family protein [Aureimonas fodinaquatilis]|uniref:NAD-dependent epimerase/dehydratase family protein n=1 Tax=Aureimonas fodinaquatilis TaxID=2565783 RepID=A0A5B0DWD5_9HYPH|nr:GDP-mannose 4,6-dehydratase [Aureimonas fodinaquatilis]KAA0971064.1 NAD-dependent epimerase/dehydratase family protein [Aureimonas fodinaquatilis]